MDAEPPPIVIESPAQATDAGTAPAQATDAGNGPAQATDAGESPAQATDAGNGPTHDSGAANEKPEPGAASAPLDTTVRTPFAMQIARDRAQMPTEKQDDARLLELGLGAFMMEGGGAGGYVGL